MDANSFETIYSIVSVIVGLFLAIVVYRSSMSARRRKMESITPAILGALVRLNAPTPGGEVHKEVQRWTREKLSLSIVYTTLDALAKSGETSFSLVSKTFRDGTVRMVRVYSITETGRKALDEVKDMSTPQSGIV